METLLGSVERTLLEDALLEGSQLGDTQLEGSQLGDTQLEGSQLGDTQLEGSQLGDTQLEGEQLGVTKFEGALLADKQLEDTRRESKLIEQILTVDLPRFGEVAYRESEVVRFPWGLPGFGTLRRFLVISVDEADGYIWLQSLEDRRVALPLCDPWSLFDDYEAPLPLYAKQSLEIERADSFCVLCVLVARPGTATTTINLLAPIIINLETRVGRQITLENARYSVHTPVPLPAAGAKEVESS